MDIILIKTCDGFPEQYDAYYGEDLVGYLRLRHGNFSVECPYVGGNIVYRVAPKGDGIFEEDEREYYLNKAKEAIMIWMGN